MEKENLFYSFSVNGDEIFCREAYGSAEGLLAHLQNVSSPAPRGFRLLAAIRISTLTL